ncbi:hypothetical protein C0580_04290 [Candidatus Parcubacteria bacterium]|nr:MAG: hypothetical protein C0580_04290 [Candidatus Parcubacteria bacterium]
MKIAHIHVWDKKNKGDHAIVLAVQELLKDNLPKVEIKDFPVETLKKITAANLKKINACDLVVIGGGGIYYSWFMPFDTAVIKKIKTPIVTFGVGYIREIGSRKLSPAEKNSIKTLNQTARLVSVRDYYTKSFLTKAGVSEKKINIIGDPAVFLKEKKIKNLKLKKKINIGLNLNYSGWLGFGKYEENIIDSYNDVIDYFSKKYNADFYYLLHHPDEKRILKKLKLKNPKIIDLPPGQQKYFYSQLDLIIGMMLHSVVLSFGANTPEINVAYDIRNKNFAKFIHCPELAIYSSKLKKGQLLKTAKMVMKNKEKYKEKFSKRKESIWQKHQDFISEIKKIT